MRALAEILRPCVRRLWRWLRESKVRYTAYDTPCEDASQQCYAHVMRRFGRLLKREPENKEYRAFVPKMRGLLAEAMKLRTKGLSPEDFAREAKRIRQKIEEMMDAQARDPALQGLQSWMRERRGELFRWTESPDIPAENNRAERGVRGPKALTRRSAHAAKRHPAFH